MNQLPVIEFVTALQEHREIARNGVLVGFTQSKKRWKAIIEKDDCTITLSGDINKSMDWLERFRRGEIIPEVAKALE